MFGKKVRVSEVIKFPPTKTKREKNNNNNNNTEKNKKKGYLTAFLH